uniref:G-protein coupled receptors family 1 profile domain-containing protein n=1 Tax=Xenopus tropicalis TaxID=8364 RepID=A0A6I8SDE2_XENTR
MEPSNWTRGCFTLLGLSEKPYHWLPLFSFFLCSYCLCIAGNCLISLLILTKPQLHTPMYILLGNLSVVDVCLASVTVPRAMCGLLSGDTSISFRGCFLQLFLFHAVGNMDSFLLAIMALDRCAAVCRPLHYYSIMSRRTCACLITLSWVIVSCLHSLLHTLMVATLEYTGVKQVNHFFCEISQVLAISDSDTSVNFLLIFTEGAVSVGAPFICIIMSYFCIVRTIVQMHSADGRSKAFSTCSSHLTAVCLFYGTIAAVYFLPSTTASLLNGRLATIGHTLLTPLLNPFIYGLRNKAIKTVFRKLFLGKLRHMFIRINDYN